jgi:ribosomal protein S18 acetylase RimI-like enzyme
MINFRAATENDAGFLVPLVTVSSGGVWNAVWRATATEGQTIEASGARYIADCNHDLSIKNTVIAERAGRGIGAMICYQEGSDAAGNNESLLPRTLVDALQPYRQLTDPNSWFIAELCLLPEARGQGVGTRLLERAKIEARRRNLPSVTLRVFGNNAGAVRLYERFGFTKQAELPVVPHPDINVSGSVLLMSCPSNP